MHAVNNNDFKKAFPIDSLVRILNQEFPQPKPPLKHRSVFELLIAVILSAQCTDERVNQTTPRLFPKKSACTPKDILKMGEENLRKIIHPCGYFNSKTKAIMGCARLLQNKELPHDFEKLRKLPGVGSKTAQVIQAQWFGMAAFPVDTHIHRVANRLGLAKSGKNRDQTERQLKEQVPREHWSRLHLQLVFHGRKTCTAYKPKCGRCPLFDICRWPGKNSVLVGK